jgi:integrase
MAKRREFGAVTQLPSGNWRARWREGDRRVNAPMTFATEEDAERYLIKIRADLLDGKVTAALAPPKPCRTLQEWRDVWLDQPGKSRNHVRRDRQGINAFPQLHHLPLDEITKLMVQDAVKSRSKQVKAGTATRDYAALRSCLYAAADFDLITAAPIPRRIGLPKVRQVNPPELTDDTLNELVSTMTDRFKMLVRMAAVLAFRWGEVIALRICDVDFDNGAVTISQTIEEAGGHLEVVPWGKTDAALRTRPAPQSLLDDLREHIEVFRPNARPTDLLFVGERDRMLRRSNFNRRHFAPAREAIGLSDLDFHHLRHHGITWLVEAEVPITVLKEWFGHKAVDMVLHYSHVTSAALKEAALKVEQRWPTA